VRRLRFQVATSLDGYIAPPDGSTDWIPMDPDIDFSALFAQFDTFLMGRRTFETAGGMAAGQRVVVASTTLEQSVHDRITIIGADLATQVAALKAEPGKDIWLFGGGELFRSLLDAELVDTVELAIVPVLLGDGTPFLSHPASRAQLTLVRHRIFKKTGIVLLEYDVQRDATPRTAGV
jgi:dihydrofolate reductase